MKKIDRYAKPCITIALFVLSGSLAFSQKKAGDDKALKADLYKAKKDAIEFLSDSTTVRKFGKMADSIWHFAETGLQEFRSSAILIRALQQEGFTIEKNVAGMPTCFVASWGSGKPVIGILGEFDALPKLSQKALTPYQDPLITGASGHGCGHNMMGTAGTAAAIAVKRSMVANNLSGTIKFFGSPAEEILIGKAYMVREGIFRDVDAIIDNHSSSEMQTGYGVSGNAVISVLFSFKGKTAHAAAAPWSGRSALDAVELMDVATNFLREHLYNTHRMHYVITDGGAAPNIVPERATVWYYLRETDERLEEMYKRVIDCAKGAALATGTTLDTIKVISGIHQKHSNRGMAEAIQRNIELIGMPEWSESENAFAKALQKTIGAEEKGYNVKVSPLKEPSAVQTGGASTDVGDVSLIAPTATLNFPGAPTGVIGHHWSTVTSGYGSAAWKGLNAGAKVIACTALDLLTKSKVLEAIKAEFAEYSKDHPFRSFLPGGTKPPLDLNRYLIEN
ncbi:MAG: amidohydrolase [Bacteroidota bacterium]|nr:amidohydrolase [Bacteroidota bacterium]